MIHDDNEIRPLHQHDELMPSNEHEVQKRERRNAQVGFSLR